LTLSSSSFGLRPAARLKEADADEQRLPPKNVRQHRAAQPELCDRLLSLGDVVEILRPQVACDAEVLGAPVGKAGKQHHEHAKVDDQERDQDELDRQIFWKAGVIIKNRGHHELDEQKCDVGLEIALTNRVGVCGDQTAIELSGVGSESVHPTFGRSNDVGGGLQKPDKG
jgi:hypothetical protein